MLLSPRISNETSAARPSAAIRGAWMFCTAAAFERRLTTSPVAARKAGLPARAVRLWIRMLSFAGNLKPASRIRSIRPD